MKKPTNYDTTEVTGEFTPLKPGGHICKIMQVKETKSKSGLDMLEISLDIAEGEQKDYYAKAYRSDTRADKKWGCVVYLVVDESTDYGVKNLKTFTTSVEKSNVGFQIAWGDNFAKCFANKLVGGVFGREQYLNASNEANGLQSVNGSVRLNLLEQVLMFQMTSICLMINLIKLLMLSKVKDNLITVMMDLQQQRMRNYHS